MKKETTKIPARFEPGKRFTLRVKPLASLRGCKERMARHAHEGMPKLTSLERGATEAQLDCLRDHLLRPMLEEANDLALLDSLRRAGNEAAAAAWLTPFPLLFLPALLEEKTQRASAHVARQKAILRKTQRSTQEAA